MAQVFPFSALVGQDDMVRAIMMAAVDPRIGGVLILGDRGTGKSTAVRALAGLLPKMKVIEGCPYNCPPDAPLGLCAADCLGKSGKQANGKMMPVPVVDLPLGVSEDRVVGALDLEAALTSGKKRFEPGLLARAHRGFLYIDEVNLLEDHIVDLLLDAAASGETIVEREGLSVRHPSRFVLIGSGNPEEGELRPQMLDRFGLAVDVSTPKDVASRVEVVRRRDAFERDPAGFIKSWARKDSALRTKITKARDRLERLEPSDEMLGAAAALCIELGTDGLRGELTLMKAARAYAALEGADEITIMHLKAIAPSALGHRLRRDPLDDTGSGARVERAVDKVLAA
ncbi:MAG: magnesium chelatase ATPase subunit I [Pseudomonadota bacterium]